MPPKKALIVIDGANVCWCHGQRKKFSVQGLKMAIDFFHEKGYRNVMSFVPLTYSQVGIVESKCKTVVKDVIRSARALQLIDILSLHCRKLAERAASARG